MALIAQRIKFRLKSVQAMPIEKKTRHSSRCRRSPKWLRRDCSCRTPCASAPDDGQLSTRWVSSTRKASGRDEMDPPSADRLGTAARALAGSYPAEDVSAVFLHAALARPGHVGGPVDLPQIRDRSPRRVLHPA